MLGLTAVETWVVSCILHVFGVLAEYALILKMIQVRNVKSSKYQTSLTSTNVKLRILLRFDTNLTVT